MLAVNLSEAVKAVRAKKAGLVVVQVPEGLKTRVKEIAGQIESKTNAKAVVLADPCFGSCDLADDKAKAIGADLVLHLGHSKMLESRVDAVYIPLSYRLDSNKMKALSRNLVRKIKELKLKRIGLFATVQYVQFLDELKELLKKKGFRVTVGEGDSRVSRRGQVLGCNYSVVRSVEKRVDGFVFFGDGLFHPLGAVFTSKKPVVVLNPMSGDVEELADKRDLFLRKRFAAISEAKNAESFGILLSTKKGQLRKRLALKLKEMVEEDGKEAVLLASDFIRPEYYLGMGVECFVNTACPRITVEDTARFKQPIINPKELEIVLGKRKFDYYKFDEFG